MLELRYPDRRRVHNLKYYTWVEQQGRTYEEIQQQWYEPNYWTDVQKQADEIDELIIEFNNEVQIASAKATIENSPANSTCLLKRKA